jgi:hypothetical protein
MVKETKIGQDKIGRNDSCPCGSGIKYKKCHGHKDSASPQRYQVDSPKSLSSLPPEVRQKIIEQEQIREEYEARYGLVRPIISKIYQGSRHVVVGSGLCILKETDTLHDFLVRYLGSCLGEDWCNSEIKKLPEEMHPITQWYLALRKYQKEQFVTGRKIQSAVFSGPAAAILHLAYDLYVLHDNSLLQRRLINRLKETSQFQGARYEAYVTASFLKAGFKIALENEADLSTKHCEFIATDKETGEKYSVEAKSRHRPGFLGYKGERQDHKMIKLGIRGLLLDALGKDAPYTRIVYIDINMPPEGANTFESSWFSELATEITNLESEGYSIPAYIFFTNHPYHYVGENEPEPNKDSLLTAINIPEFKLSIAEKTKSIDPIISRLFDSILQHSRIPDSFYP